MRRTFISTLVVLAALAGCERADSATSDSAGDPSDRRTSGHLLTDIPSGIAVELPSIWKDRYRLSDTLSANQVGVERQLSLRFIRADSGIVDPPMLVIRVVRAEAWTAVPEDTARARYGSVVARDASRMIAMRTARENPLKAGTADALAFDSLMMFLLQRPMRTQVRR